MRKRIGKYCNDHIQNPLLQLRCCAHKAAFFVFARSARSSISFYITIVIDNLCIKIKEGIEMCSVGGGDFDFEIEKIELTRYKCKDCGNKFYGIGEKVLCPSCQSENVVTV